MGRPRPADRDLALSPESPPGNDEWRNVVQVAAEAELFQHPLEICRAAAAGEPGGLGRARQPDENTQWQRGG